MPIYQCFSPEGLLEESARSSLAEEITRIHCDATGIPRSYVNVMFTDVPAGRYFVAGKPSGHSVLSGAIRLGRDVETRQRILRELSQMWTRLTGQPEEELLVSLWENPAEKRDGGRFDLPGNRPGIATRAHLLDRLGRKQEAVAAYESAISLTHDTAERQYLEHRRDLATGF
jgi:phenylpyruvate tautomerase PptA (4-oxalocrotonate tautomerase family)